VCRGTGTIDGKPRRGISAFPTVEGLYHYMIATGADLENCLILELEAEIADDVDFDADQGALLVLPVAIRECTPVDRAVYDRVSASSEQITAGH
jgi:hypothetical protein